MSKQYFSVWNSQYTLLHKYVTIRHMQTFFFFFLTIYEKDKQNANELSGLVGVMCPNTHIAHAADVLIGMLDFTLHAS